MFRFEKLEVWQKAIEHAARVYEATRSFPDNERFGLTSQMRRSAVSLSSNIAEGSGRTSDVDFARFLEIAYGSLMEVVSQAKVAKLQGFLERVARMLSGLRTSLLQKAPPKSGPRLSTLDS
jgi:four helix bundle protein